MLKREVTLVVRHPNCKRCNQGCLEGETYLSDLINLFFKYAVFTVMIALVLFQLLLQKW
ncbi:uncharacterized protein LOC143243169 isoform X4 [Tachypleus tridentatus]|uniref:uncharacterized protein LOC143243169 isoform X4 n=1 Tax=Tachypleus tridentatus TaxID=6853 RepID=UPI003FD5643A